MRLLGRTPRPHRHDVVIAAAGLLSGLVLWSLGLATSDCPVPLAVPSALTLVPLAVMTGAELLRRTAPAVALPVATVALALDQAAGSLLATVLMFTDVVYAAVYYGTPARARRIPLVCVALTVLATVVPLAVTRDVDTLLVGAVVGLVVLAPAWTGAGMRAHRETAETERLRAEQTALLAELDRRGAVHAERARMARELHDMVANHLSAIAIHSSAALSVARNDPEAAQQALGTIRESSVAGLAEMRRLIGLLRTASADEQPAPVSRLDALDSLLEPAGVAGTASGLTFSLHDRRPRAQAVPTPVELAAYRIVQESVTNALKHAAPGAVDITLEQCRQRLAITVDSPFRARPGPRVPGAGAGLIGMAERAALLEGTLLAGPSHGPVEGPDGEPRPGPVWRVRAELPLHSEPVGTPATN